MSRRRSFIRKSRRYKIINHEGHEGARRLEFDKLSRLVIGCAIEVHKYLGPGLLESTYEQLLTYMKLSGIRIGLLMNFNVKHMKSGIKRMVL